MFDTVIRGGRVVDGSGGPARSADVAIRDGRIVEIGAVSGDARETIDAAVASAFAVGVLVMAWLTPSFVGDASAMTASAERSADRGGFLAVLPVFVLIIRVLGGIYGGLFTPTEAGAAGVAVKGAILGASDPGRAAAALRRALDR